VSIPTSEVTIAERATDKNGNAIQKVSIDLSEQGFGPAIVVVELNLDAEWHIFNSLPTVGTSTEVLIAAYNTRIPLLEGDNTLYFSPLGSFDFSTGNNAFYGYVKVVDSLNDVDVEAIRAQVAAFEPLIYPPEFFAGGAGDSCCL
jgi:hypothetical protein